MDELTLAEAMDEMESAEDFLQYFGVPYDASVVHVNRLHILQRFHDYITRAGQRPGDEAALRTFYTAQLARAYQDFVESDALTEKVFKVFHMHEPQTAFVPIASITLAAKQPDAGLPVSGGCGCGGSGSCHSSEAALRD